MVLMLLKRMVLMLLRRMGPRYIFTLRFNEDIAYHLTDARLLGNCYIVCFFYWWWEWVFTYAFSVRVDLRDYLFVVFTSWGNDIQLFTITFGFFHFVFSVLSFSLGSER